MDILNSKNQPTLVSFVKKPTKLSTLFKPYKKYICTCFLSKKSQPIRLYSTRIRGDMYAISSKLYAVEKWAP